MKVIVAAFLLFTFSVSGQAPDYKLLTGKWHLKSISRNVGEIVIYNASNDNAEGYPPVYWEFRCDTIVIPSFIENEYEDTIVCGMWISGNITVPATDTAANRVVESHGFAFSGDTLILTRTYTRGLEMATITNADKVYYKIETLTDNKLVLVYYDKLAGGGFRTIDKYSRRYVFSKEN